MARREIDTIWDRKTRNNINENFIELYNEYIGAGLDAKEARQKAEEAIKKANSVQEQFNQVVIEGDSSVEAAQARVDAKGNTYSTLKERLDVKETEFSSQLAQTSEVQTNYLQHFSEEPYIVEKQGEIHTGGFRHTAFFGGCTFKNREIYVGRNSEHHFTTVARGTIVGYIRNFDGTFTSKVIIPSSDVDPRDINIVTSRDGNKLFLSAACVVGSSSTNADYITYLWELDEDLNVIGSRKKLFDGFGWGNILITPNGKILKTRYNNNQTFTGVRLMRSINHSSSQSLDSEEVATIFPYSGEKPTECTIAYWNNKLVALTRQDDGNMLYRETYNLEGDDGWGEIIDLGFQGHAPALQPYNKDETLVATISALIPWSSGQGFSRFQAVIGSDNGYDFTDPVVVSSVRGSYGTIVPNRYGIGIMSYQEFNDGDETEVQHLDVDINKILNIQNLPKYEKMKRKTEGSIELLGDCKNFSYFDNSHQLQKFIYFKLKHDLEVNALYLFTKNNSDNDLSNVPVRFQRVNDDGTATTIVSIYGDTIPSKENEPERVRFPLPTPLTFDKDQLYRIRIEGSFSLGKTSYINNNRTAVNADLGHLVYVKSTIAYSSSFHAFDNSIYPFEIEITQ